MMRILDFDGPAHVDGVRACIVELQNFERALDPRMPSGAEIVDEYVPYMLDRCRRCSGKVMVAEIEGTVAGFVTILTRVSSDEIDDGPVEFGLVADLVVAREYRNRGIGAALLEAAESYAQENEVNWLRIGVLAANAVADRMYAARGFETRFLMREKDLRALRSSAGTRSPRAPPAGSC